MISLPGAGTSQDSVVAIPDMERNLLEAWRVPTLSEISEEHNYELFRSEQQLSEAYSHDANQESSLLSIELDSIRKEGNTNVRDTDQLNLESANTASREVKDMVA